MLQTRANVQRRTTWLAGAGALVLCAFLFTTQGQAFASTLLQLFRGQTLQAVPTSYSDLQNGYATLRELAQLGSLQGTPPTQLNTVSSMSAAASMAGFSPATPSAWPTDLSHTPASIKALAPSQVTLTLSKATADAYFTSKGLSTRLPALYDGQQLIVSFPGVSVLEYLAAQGGARLYVGQAGQLVVNTTGSATVAQLRD
jgi:hypothetical protein